MKQKCRNCESNDGVRSIIWGLPAGPLDESKCYIGGCLVEDNPSKYICIACDVQFGERRNTELGHKPMVRSDFLPVERHPFLLIARPDA